MQARQQGEVGSLRTWPALLAMDLQASASLLYLPSCERGAILRGTGLQSPGKRLFGSLMESKFRFPWPVEAGGVDSVPYHRFHTYFVCTDHYLYNWGDCLSIHPSIHIYIYTYILVLLRSFSSLFVSLIPFIFVRCIPSIIPSLNQDIIHEKNRKCPSLDIDMSIGDQRHK